jgi:hypothetical protein
MALVLKDRVRETSTTTGSLAFTLAGPVAGFQSFSAIGTGNQTYYTIAGASDWEVGIGTWTSPDQLSRDTILASTNAGAAVSFGAGTKDVFATFPAEGFAVAPPIGGTTPNTITGTTITANTEIDLPAVVNTNTTTGRLYMADGGDGYDYLNIDTWDGSSQLLVSFPGGLTASGILSANSFQSSIYNVYDPISANSIVISATSGTGQYTLKLPTSAGSANQVLKTDGSGNLDWTYPAGQGNAPVTITAATYSVAATDIYLIANRAGTVTLTLPAASSSTGRIITVKNVQAQTVVSNASNVVPIGSTTAGTAILANTAGKFATLVSDGTNWIIMQAN